MSAVQAALLEASRAALRELDGIRLQNMGAHVYRATEALRAAIASASAQQVGVEPVRDWKTEFAEMQAHAADLSSQLHAAQLAQQVGVAAEPVAYRNADQPNAIAWCPGYPESLPDISPLYARPALTQPVPQGWRVQIVSDGDVRVYGPAGDSWLVRAGDDGFYGFVHGLLTAMAAPQSKQPGEGA